MSTFEQVRRANGEYWNAARNDMARGSYGEAMCEKRRLAGASDAHLLAEIAASRRDMKIDTAIGSLKQRLAQRRDEMTAGCAICGVAARRH